MSAPEPAGPLDGVLRPGRHGAASDDPVRIAVRRCDLVQVTARRGLHRALTDRLRGSFGIDLPGPGQAAAARGVTALWLQPQGWMLQAPRGEEGALARRVAAASGPAGSVVDQSHGRAVLSLSGAHAREVLERLCRIDLHPRAFGPGRVAVTPLGGLPGLLHQTDALPGFDLVVVSTLAEDFVQALTRAASESGYAIV